MLNKTARRWLRIIHLVFITFLMGGLISIFVISNIEGLRDSDLFILNYSMYSLFNIVVTFSFFGIIATGLVYSVFTHWGLTKHWWIMAKWLGTLSAFFLVWIWLGPAINGMTALSDAGLSTAFLSHQYHSFANSIGPAILVLISIFVTLIIITIFKPWGIREQQLVLKRGTILVLVGSAVVISIGFGLLGYYDMQKFRKMQIGTPDLAQISDGKYTGTQTYAGFEYVVEVEVQNKRIININILENRDSPYAVFAEGILARVIKQQSPDVDAITGATTTSKCLMKAMESALEGAIE